MINQYRKTLNDKVRKLGNKIKPSFLGLPKELKTGLGDLLTADVNFARIGLVTGIALPLVGAYEYNSYAALLGGGNCFGSAMYSFAVNISTLFIPSYLGGVLGFGIGKEADKYLHDKYNSYKSCCANKKLEKLDSEKED